MQTNNSAWQLPDFRRLWWGQTISEMGSQLGAMSLLAVLVLDATPAQMGLLGTMATAPALLLGLPAGVWLDRVRRRRILIAADLLRLVVLVLIAVLALLGQLTMPILLSLAFLGGCGMVLFRLAHEAYVPVLVPAEALVDANSRLGASSAVAESVAPALGGILVDLLTAPVTLLLDGLSYLLSALFLSRIEAPEMLPEVEAGAAPSFWGEIRSGFRAVLDRPVLRALAGFAATWHFFGNFIGATYTLFVIRELGLSPTWLGIIVGSGGIGAVAGALLVGRLAGRFHLGRFLLVSAGVHALLVALIPLASGPAWRAALILIIGQIGGDVFHTLFEINSLTLRQRVTPAQLLGRTGSVFQFSANVAMMLGLLVGGGLATWLSLRAALWLAFGGMALGLLWLLPLRRLAGFGATR
ncbi:MAG: MFS transporter [Ardenticatenales bacterium]|nr:MFS transporter [Ardenticatenales bacterium]